MYCGDFAFINISLYEFICIRGFMIYSVTFTLFLCMSIMNIKANCKQDILGISDLQKAFGSHLPGRYIDLSPDFQGAHFMRIVCCTMSVNL